MRSSLAILITLGACTDHGASQLTKIKDQVCACTTAACAEQAMEQVPKATIASNHRTQTIARGMLDCLAKLEAAERPSTDPDAEGSAASSEAAPAAGSAVAPTPAKAAPGSASPAGKPAVPAPPAAAPITPKRAR